MIGWLDLWHINPCRLFNAKSCIYIYLINVYDLLVGLLVDWVYGMSTFVGYLMTKLVYIYISNIWFVNEYFIGNSILKQANAHSLYKWFEVLLSNTNSFICT